MGCKELPDGAAGVKLATGLPNDRDRKILCAAGPRMASSFYRVKFDGRVRGAVRVGSGYEVGAVVDAVRNVIYVGRLRATVGCRPVSDGVLRRKDVCRAADAA